MLKVKVVTEQQEARAIWESVIPQENVSDLWEFRECFQRQYQRPLHFIVAEEDGRICGLLPLSWIEEKNVMSYFPGETWQGKSWLEQNRVIAENRRVLRAMLNRCPSEYHLRYLLPTEEALSATNIVDEIGYLFNPPHYDYKFDNYMEEFSHKSARRLVRELDAFDARGVEYRFDQIEDFDIMARMNIERYGIFSYFYDTRFSSSFRSLAEYLHANGMLRMTTISVEGNVAAVDMGCVYNGTYTLLAGGTNGEFPGIAKLINTFHMKRACNEKFDSVDFLCGDFSWKSIFHLSMRPLYLVSNVSVASVNWDAMMLRPAIGFHTGSMAGRFSHV